MRNYFGGLHQFPTNILGGYRVAVIGDVVLSGPVHCSVELDRFLGTATRRGITDALYLGPSLSPAEAHDWPQKPDMTTWCLNPLPHNGNGRDDLRAAPPGFAIVRPGYMIPVFLHHYRHPSTPPPRYTEDAAVHLVAGLSRVGDRELPNGGYEISIGTNPIAAAVVELQLNDNGGLECSVEYFKRENVLPDKWP